MTAFLSTLTQVSGFVWDMVGQVAAEVTAQPMFLVPAVIGFAATGIGIFKSLSR